MKTFIAGMITVGLMLVIAGLLGAIVRDSIIISQDLTVIKDLVDDLRDEEEFGFFFVDRKPPEPRDDFVCRVLDVAKKIEMYDVTFTKSSAIIKSIKIYVVTKRRPPIEWLRDSSGNIVGALVWYWKEVVRYPEDIEKFIKQKLKTIGGKKKR